MKSLDKGQKFAVIRGRHRTEAAKLAGIEALRCNVHANGRLGLYEIPVEDLVVDEESQFEWAYTPGKVRRIAKNWDPRAVGVLDVTPVTGGLSKMERNQLKLKMDRDQRSVSGIEVFLNEVNAGDEVAIDIKKIVEEHKFEIGKNRKTTWVSTRIEAVATLRSIYRAGGADLLNRTLTMAEMWYDEPQSVTNHWLGALTLFCLAGYDSEFTEEQIERLQKLVPATEIKKAQGMSESIVTGSAGSGMGSPLAALLCERLRVVAKKRKAKPTTQKEDTP